ncbi:MAG: hypothetical protein H0W34_06990 [Pyrinomonadaceae bacterium]|nr:hypothetical protein [Pyrinomonadaceae bacterium]
MSNESVDKHFHDLSAGDEKEDKGYYIFLCKTPDIGLLDVIRRHDATTIGFAFREGSVLAHLSVVLREKGIPAIVSGYVSLQEGDTVTIDALSTDISREERVKR